GVVTLAGDRVTIAGRVWRSGGKGNGAAIQVELVELFDHTAGVFDDRDVADVAIGGSDRGGEWSGPAPSRASRLPVKEKLLGGGIARGAASGRVVTGLSYGGEN